MRKYNVLLNCSKKYQLKKLKSPKNKRKSSFDKLSIPYLAGRLHDEVNELDQELARYRGSVYDYVALRDEAADIANFASMIILHCTKELFRRAWYNFHQRLDYLCSKLSFK